MTPMKGIEKVAIPEHVSMLKQRVADEAGSL
jgi:hypothetical protein